MRPTNRSLTLLPRKQISDIPRDLTPNTISQCRCRHSRLQTVLEWMTSATVTTRGLILSIIQRSSEVSSRTSHRLLRRLWSRLSVVSSVTGPSVCTSLHGFTSHPSLLSPSCCCTVVLRATRKLLTKVHTWVQGGAQVLSVVCTLTHQMWTLLHIHAKGEGRPWPSAVREWNVKGHTYFGGRPSSLPLAAFPSPTLRGVKYLLCIVWTKLHM